MADQQTRPRKPRNQTTDPTPKPTISSLLFPNDSNSNLTITKKKNTFSPATFRALGCTASSQVSVPSVIRNSANWETKKLKKKRFKSKNTTTNNNHLLNITTNGNGNGNNTSCVVVGSNNNNSNNGSNGLVSLALSSSCVGMMNNDVWCGPGIGLTTDAASVDCVVTRRNSARGKLDVRPCGPRRMVSPELDPFFETDSNIGMRNFHADISASSRHNRHVRHGFREGLAEIVMLQTDMLMGGRFDGLDGYRDLRLDVDNMTYEELLELGDKIGHVSTGLREDAMTRCLRRSRIAFSGNLSSLSASEMEKKCSICQEEYEEDDETGRLHNCGHTYHIDCIKQWLGQKKICPVCKREALPQN